MGSLLGTARRARRWGSAADNGGHRGAERRRGVGVVGSLRRRQQETTYRSSRRESSPIRGVGSTDETSRARIGSADAP